MRNKLNGTVSVVRKGGRAGQRTEGERRSVTKSVKADVAAGFVACLGSVILVGCCCWMHGNGTRTCGTPSGARPAGRFLMVENVRLVP